MRSFIIQRDSGGGRKSCSASPWLKNIRRFQLHRVNGGDQFLNLASFNPRSNEKTHEFNFN